MAAWVAFSFASLLPLSVALVLLVVARRWTLERLQALQRFFERRLQTIFVVLLVLVAVALLRNGIAGLTA
jgi:phosphotransferase system  glucose/maltose/N-acetylglucosamine-specific IIC component